MLTVKYDTGRDHIQTFSNISYPNFVFIEKVIVGEISKASLLLKPKFKIFKGNNVHFP